MTNDATRPELLEGLIERRISRRAALRGSMALALGAPMLTSGCNQPAQVSDATFAELPHVYPNKPRDVERAKGIGFPDGFDCHVVVGWGDPILPNAPPLDIAHQTPAAQENQFGYNNDYVGFLPLDAEHDNVQRGLLAVNHEYTNPELMFEGLTYDNKRQRITDDEMRIEMAAQGMSIVEIERRRDAGGMWSPWRIVPDGSLNRRITLNTPMRVAGPAAGHQRMKTSADATGERVLGTVNNCSGGMTPWETVLSGEENFHKYFIGDAEKTPEAENHRIYGVGQAPEYAWERIDSRFDVENEPNEPNRFGWIVEVDPRDPAAMPVKRTALGRFRHEGASAAICRDGRVAIYMGDDERFAHLYKFVSARPYKQGDAANNADLLDDGTLYVARFSDDGTVRWLPLVFGQGPLTTGAGFQSQADVLIETRRAARLLGATPMDRPEDVEVNPATGHVYVMLTNNSERPVELTDSANPRAHSRHGHIIELVVPTDGGIRDHAATHHTWDVFLLAGDPANPADSAHYHQETSRDGWLSSPDSCGFDPQGRLWIATDGGEVSAGITDGVYVAETSGPRRALTRHIFHVPTGAEACSPCFTPDGETLFIAVQHPGQGTSFDNPSTRWPDNNPGLPPRPAIVAITRSAGGPIL